MCYYTICFKGEKSMKEMYVPTMDELYLMQDMGSNIYRYLVANVIERLILDGLNTPARGVLKSACKYLG